MSSHQQLRVVGSRPIFRFFLPPPGKPFRSSEFLLAGPGQPGLRQLNAPNSHTLTIVVEPEDYEVESLASLPGVVWLWFLSPLVQEESSPILEAPRLARQAQEILAHRRRFLEDLLANNPFSVVVSDSESFEYCESRGYDARLSPPPVSEDVSAFAKIKESGISVMNLRERTDYSLQYLNLLPNPVELAEVDSFFEAESLKIPSHWVLLRETLSPCFPYEAAFAVVAGKTLISQALTARWGLEPGLDYIEYSTPEELCRVINHLARYPQSTQLMSWRGMAKSQIFSATRVFSRLFSESNQKTSHRV